MKPPEIKRVNLDRLRIKTTGNVCKKVYFGTQKDADEYIEKLQKTSKRDKVPVHSYLCERCMCWHLTSWSAPDIEKVIKETNEEINELIEEYNLSIEDWLVWFKAADKVFQDMEIENHNLRWELAKLKTKLKKYEH